ncbi:MAG: hypothetical protein KKE20_00950 [Nanoarchaeota archaeon]|nr:hypothetical protein [Nanoarchaeota archaeon]
MRSNKHNALQKVESFVEFDDLIDHLAQKQAVLWAGSHVNPQVVQNQTYVLNALYQAAAKVGKKVNIGLEAFKSKPEEKEFLSMLHDPKKIIEALGILSTLYLPQDLEIPEDYVPTSFKQSVSPFIDVALKCGMQLYPMAPVIEGKGQIKYWNSEVAQLILDHISDDTILFSLNGRRHFDDPPYEKISIPQVLSEKKPSLNIAVIVQSEVTEHEPLIKPIYSFPCDCYGIEGNLSR